MQSILRYVRYSLEWIAAAVACYCKTATLFLVLDSASDGPCRKHDVFKCVQLPRYDLPSDLIKYPSYACVYEGYTLGSLSETSTGLIAKLGLAGPACNAFGQDISNLTIQVTYESQSRWVIRREHVPPLLACHRLHVNIFDTENKQFTIPESVITRPPAPSASHTETSDLVFNYDPSPFAFWITRRSDLQGSPLFDTRIASLPKTPIPSSSNDASTALDGFPLVFEDQYLQVSYYILIYLFVCYLTILV